MDISMRDLEAFLPRLLSLPSSQRQRASRIGGLYKLPMCFQWLMPFWLATMSTPRSQIFVAVRDGKLLMQTIVTLTEEQPLPKEWFTNGRI